MLSIYTGHSIEGGSYHSECPRETKCFKRAENARVGSPPPPGCIGKLRGFVSLTADADLHTDELGIGASGCEPKILFQMNEPSTAQAKAHIEPRGKPSIHDGLSECDTNREMKVSSWLAPVRVSKNKSTQCLLRRCRSPIQRQRVRLQ
jgi:hypothetical protein